MRRTFFVCSLALLLIPGAAAAQSRPVAETIELADADPMITDAQVVYQTWRSLQRQARTEAGDLALQETIDAVFDSQTGAWKARQDVTLDRQLGAGEWQRTIQNLETNGRIADRAEWDGLQEQWSRLLGDTFKSRVEDPAMPLALLKNMQPTGLAHEVLLKGARHWRIDMVPLQPDAAYDRVTLWVHQESGHLSRTRAEAQLPHSSIVATTEYRRTLGVDVPHLRHLKGSIQTRRRSRIRSVFFDIRCMFEPAE